MRVQPEGAVGRGVWAELESQYASSYLVDDTLAVRTRPWWATYLRVGWDVRVGAMRIAPWLGVNNLFDRRYVSSVVVNAARGRYYEPAPGRNVYLGVTMDAGR